MSFETDNDLGETENNNHWELYHRICDVVEKYVNGQKLANVREKFSRNLHETVELIYRRVE